MVNFAIGDKVLAELEIASITYGEDGSPIYLVNSPESDSYDRFICCDYVYPLENGKPYDEGLNDAWMAVRKLISPEQEGGIPADCAEEIFGQRNAMNIIRENSPRSVLARIGEWERKNIKKGSLVRRSDDRLAGVVVSVEEDTCGVLWEDGEFKEEKKKDFYLTGKTADLKVMVSQTFREKEKGRKK